MKHILALLLLVGSLTTTLQAQKVYSTRTGKISFYSKAPLEDIEATNNEVESKLSSSTGLVIFMLLMKGFKFENQLMEEHFNEDYLESSKYPKSDFKGYITNVSAINFAKDGTYAAKVKGTLTLHGVSKEVEANGSIEVKGGKPVAKTKFPIKLKDYKIGGSMVGKKIAETIMVEVNCKYE